MNNQIDLYTTPRLARTSKNIDWAKIKHENAKLGDVVAQFDAIHETGDLLAAWDGGLFNTQDRLVRYTRVNIKPFNVAKNHFQGMQRLGKGNGNYLIFSGGDAIEKTAHLFVIELGTRKKGGPWGSNIIISNQPKPQDKLVKIIALDNEFWHPGGVSVSGEVLVVPLQNRDKTKVMLLHVENPLEPTLLCEFITPDIPKAGAAAVAKLNNGRFVCAVWREAKKKHRGRIDFYLSKDHDLRNGFLTETRKTWKYGDLNLAEDRDPAYQNINFITPEDTLLDANTTGLFLIGTENESSGEPVGHGANLADLFEVKIPNNLSAVPEIERVKTRPFRCNREYGNMDAAAGIHVDPSTGGLNLYVGYHWRVENQFFRFAEFRSTMSSTWVELYEGKSFTGRKLSIVGQSKSDTTIQDYTVIAAESHEFGHQVMSVKYQIPDGSRYRLFKAKSLRGDQVDVDYVELSGTGQVENFADLGTEKPDYGSQVLSSSYV